MKTLRIGHSAPTPLGIIWIAASETGLWSLDFQSSEEDFIKQTLKRGQAEIIKDSQNLSLTLNVIETYLAGKSNRLDLPIDWTGMTPFQIAVRKAVIAIPAGQTASYGEIAKKVGKAGASRAVGRVNATNPIPLVIPCHRVIGADGSLTGYGGAGGLETKAWLLALEKGNFGNET